MAKKKRKKTRPPVRPASATPPFGPYEAICEPLEDSRVLRGKPLTDDQAVRRLQAGRDIAVCGADPAANEAKARELATRAWAAVFRDNAHDSGGRWRALRHFHPSPKPDNAPHAFYEEPPRRTTSEG